jgi:hypothetical protein
LVKQRKGEPQNHERQKSKNQAADERHISEQVLDGLQMRAAREAERADDGERAERDGRPVKHDPQQPVAPARDAPDVVERRLDIGEHPDRDDHEQQHPDAAERDALRFLHKGVDLFRGFFLCADADHGRAASRVVSGRGHRICPRQGDGNRRA